MKYIFVLKIINPKISCFFFNSIKSKQRIPIYLPREGFNSK